MPPSHVRKLRLRLLSQWCLSSLSPAPGKVFVPVSHGGLPGSLTVSFGAYISPGQAWQGLGWGWTVRASTVPGHQSHRGAKTGKRNVYKVTQMVIQGGDGPWIGQFGPGDCGLRQNGASRGLCQPQAVLVAAGSSGGEAGREGKQG